MKSILLWAGILSVTFTTLLAGIFFAKDSLFEQTQEDVKPGMPQASRQVNRSVPDSLQANAVAQIDSLNLVIEALLRQLEESVEKNQQVNYELQQEKAAVKSLMAKADSLENEIALIQASKLKVRDLTKTLGTMKTDVLAPILTNLSNDVIRVLYAQAKSRDKQKIFNAIPPERARQLLVDATRKLD